jgi:hypothetical protein
VTFPTTKKKSLSSSVLENHEIAHITTVLYFQPAWLVWWQGGHEDRSFSTWLQGYFNLF